ncbi:MAG TPA: hypothetical protein VGI45_20280 [Terracidiphilus sp.]|jgi:hypothetical protein
MAKRWYDRLTRPTSQEITTAYKEWLGQVPWKLFATYTFTWSVSDAQADDVFKAYINELEKLLRSPIAFVRGDEKRSAAFGLSENGRHFHTLLTSIVPLDPSMFKTRWYRYAGTGHRGDSADVRKYTPQLDGIGYCLKLIDETEGDWTLRNLDFFIPNWSATDPNRRSRRRAARNEDRENYSS